MKRVMTASVLALGVMLGQGVSAQEATTGQQLIDKVYLTAGLQGIGIGLGKSYSENIGFRVDLNGGSLDDDYNESGTMYRGKLELQSAGGYVDYFPFSGGFRVTAGLAYFGSDLSLSAAGDGTGQPADIGGTQVVLTPGDRIDATVEWPSVAPYLGIGFGHGHSKNSGLYLGADLGVYIGDFKSSLTVSPSLRAKLLAAGGNPDADIQRERDELEDAVSGLGFVPSLQLYVGYRF